MALNDCILWYGTKGGNGYGIKRVNGRWAYIHRLSWMAANGSEIPKGMVIAHKCDTPNCYNPNHLFICTQKENLQDMHTKGRGQSGDSHWAKKMPLRVSRGEKVGTSKLLEHHVEEIRKSYTPGNRWHPSGNSIYDLAKRYGVSPQTISRIVRNELWRAI